MPDFLTVGFYVMFVAIGYILYKIETRKKIDLEFAKFVITTSIILQEMKKELDELKKSQSDKKTD